MKKTKLILLGMLAVLMLIPQATAYTVPSIASYNYATGYTAGEPNPMMVVNLSATPNVTVFFWTNSSGTWIMAHSLVVAGPQVAHPVFWNTSSWYGQNGSTTTYYWRYCLWNNSAANYGTGWTNLSSNYTYTVRELTMGEVTVSIVFAFIPMVIGIALIVLFMESIGKWMKF